MFYGLITLLVAIAVVGCIAYTLYALLVRFQRGHRGLHGAGRTSVEKTAIEQTSIENSEETDRHWQQSTTQRASVMSNFDQASSTMSSLPLASSSDSLTRRSIIVAVIALVMLIPLAMMQGVVGERSGLYQSVLYDIANTWGGEQHIKGPVLIFYFKPDG